MSQWLTHPTRNQEIAVRSLASLSGLRIQHCHELCVGCRCGSDLALPWLWCNLAASALIRPLAWEPPYATGTGLKKKKRKETNSHRKKQTT